MGLGRPVQSMNRALWIKIIGLALALCCLVGCASGTELRLIGAGRPIAQGSVSEFALERMQQKLFPIDTAAMPVKLSYDALVDEDGVAVLGPRLQGLDKARLLLAAVAEWTAAAQRDALASELLGDEDFVAGLFSRGAQAMPELFLRTHGGQLFVDKERAAAWLAGIGGEEAAPAGFLRDHKNKGYVFAPQPVAQNDCLLTLVLGQGGDEQSTLLELELRKGGLTSARVRVHCVAAEDSDFGLVIQKVEYLPAEAGDRGFAFAQGIELRNSVELAQLGLRVKAGKGLKIEPGEDGLRMYVLPDGFIGVKSGEGQSGYAPKASLTILAQAGEDFTAKDSAQASAQASIEGYAAKGMSLHNLQLLPTAFLGRDNAYLLSYTAKDQLGATRQSVRHYVLSGGNGGFYHFVFCFEQGVSAEEETLLRQAASAIGFIKMETKGA